jgi:hypothetical protein
MLRKRGRANDRRAVAGKKRGPTKPGGARGAKGRRKSTTAVFRLRPPDAAEQAGRAFGRPAKQRSPDRMRRGLVRRSVRVRVMAK